MVPGIAARYHEELVAQYCSLTLYALWEPQPVKDSECVNDVVGVFQIEDQPSPSRTAAFKTDWFVLHLHAIAVCEPQPVQITV